MNWQSTYDFIAPAKIVFGWGRRVETGQHGRSLGNRAMLVRGMPDEVANQVLPDIVDPLLQEGIEVVELGELHHEPEVADVDRLTDEYRRQGVKQGDFLIGVGGGAAIDLAKAVAALATNPAGDSVADYLENVGRDLKLIEQPLPVLAIPTTAGTGAEATKNAVISSYDPPFKKSLRDDLMMPRVALIDPELTVSVPPEVTAASGMDAITQLIESYISRRAKPIPRALSVEGLRRAMPAIVEAVEDGSSRTAREAMSHAALLSGMALANSGLGLAHGVAPALGIHCRTPHGAACALMLPTALRVNRTVCEEELGRLAHAVFGAKTRGRAGVDMLIEEIESIGQQIGTPSRLSDVGVTAEQIPAIVKSSRGNSMNGNPVQLSDDELTEILENLL